MQRSGLVMLLDELKPRRELAKLRMTISAERVEQEQALDAFGMAQGISGRDRSAPVLDHEGDTVEIERIDETRQILHVGLQRIGGSRGVSLFPKPMWSGTITR